MKEICIFGLGYIGLPTAATFANSGFKVYGVDVNERVIDILNNGEVHIQEPGLRMLVQAAFESGNLQVSKYACSADAYIIAVPTPFLKDIGQNGQGQGNQKKADMSYVQSAAETIASSYS